MPRMLKLILGQLLLLVVVLGVAILAAEAVARRKFPELRYSAERQQRPEDLFVRFDARYGWSNRPGAKVRFQRRDFDTEVEINALGFRGPEFGAGHRDRARVAILGDSYVFGHGVEEDETFAALLRQRWPHAEVGNFGVIGYSTDQELLLLRDTVLPLDPTLVVLCLYRNDVLDNGQSTAWGLYRKPRFVRAGDGSLGLDSGDLDADLPFSMRLRRSLRRHFVLYDVVAFRVAGLRAGVDESGSGASESLTRDLLLEAAALCQNEEIPFLLVVLPGFGDLGFLDGVPPEDAGARLDLGPIFSQFESEHPDSALGFTYDSHWNPRGHRLVAAAIATAVAAHGWLEGSPDPEGGTP